MLKKREMTLFLIASALIGASQSLDSAVFNNFLSDVMRLDVIQRSALEFPRELPGFLVVFMVGGLMILGDVRIAAVASGLAAFGMLGLGLWTDSYGSLLVWMTLYSMGQHLWMPVSNSIAMHLSETENMGTVLGRVNGINTAAYLVTSLIVYIVIRLVGVSFPVAFGIGALAYALAAGIILTMTPHRDPKRKRQLRFEKRFSLFYALSVIFGARKQIFITFGPWVLIQVFKQGVSTFAIISFIVAAIGVFFKPWVGKLIDSRGERFVIQWESLLLIVVCLGYAGAVTLESHSGIAGTALIITAGCFVGDQVLLAATMARSTWVKRIALPQDDVSKTLSMGVSIDHAVSMVIPWLGGFLWNAAGYESVFLVGAALALGNYFLAARMSSHLLS